jgi:Ca2+-binding RTX toxin-like protein
VTDNPNVYQGQLGDARPNDVQISADGSTIYAAGADGHLYVYSAQTGSLLHDWTVGTNLGGMDISPDGSFAVVTDLTPLQTITHANPPWDSEFVIGVYKVSLATGVVSTFTQTVTYDQSVFYDPAVLSDGTVLLTEKSAFTTGYTKLLNLQTGTFSDVNWNEWNTVLSPTADGSYVLGGGENVSDAPLMMFQAGSGIIATHGGYADGVQGFNRGVQAISDAGGFVAQVVNNMDAQVNVYNTQLHYEMDLRELYPDLMVGGVAAVAFDSAGQYLFVLDNDSDSIIQFSTSDWSIVKSCGVGVDVSTIWGDFGNDLLVAPDLSYFTVLTDQGLLMVDASAPVQPTEGDDHIVGSADADTIDGLGGNDTINGLAGDDNLSGSEGDDTLIGGAGADTLDGGDGNDILHSADESPTYIPVYDVYPHLDHGTEVDTLSGGAGDDLIFAGYGDNVDGGDQDWNGDSLYISFQGAASGVDADFSGGTLTVGGGTITGIENVIYVEGSNYDDYINTQSPGAYVYAGAGQLLGLDGNDTLIAGDNIELVDGGNGDDTIYTSSTVTTVAIGGVGNDTIYSFGETHGGDGNDTIVLGETYSYYSIVTGDAGDDTITGNLQDDRISGGDGADTIDGGDGNDTLYSDVSSSTYDPWSGFYPTLDHGTDVDTLIGGSGNDIIFAGYGDNVDGGNDDYGDSLYISFQGATSGVDADFSQGTITVGGGTITGIEFVVYVEGSNFDDYINTRITSDSGVSLGAGDLLGFDGNDTLIAGPDIRIVDGGNGDDTIYSAYGIMYGSIAYGGSGNDTIYASGEAHGGDGADAIVGTDTNDAIFSGNQQFVWEYDNGTERDTIMAGAGDDIVSAGYGDDVDGGEGTDGLFLSFGGASAGVTFDSASLASGPLVIGGGTIQNFEAVGAVRGSEFGDHITVARPDDQLTVDGAGGDDAITVSGNVISVEGGDGNDAISIEGGSSFTDGGAGNDQIEILAGTAVVQGGDGDDVVRVYGGFAEATGGEGYDIFWSGSDADTFEGGDGGNLVDYQLSAVAVTVNLVNGTASDGDRLFNIDDAYGTAFNDTITGNATANFLAGRDGNDTLTGGDGDDQLKGGNGDDTLVGGNGNDFLIGDAGSDHMTGGTGDDIYLVDSAGDVVTELTNAGTDAVVSSFTYTLGANIENGTLTGNAAINLTGNDLDNDLIGNADANVLTGGGGSDWLNGGDGADTMIGGAGNDTYLVQNVGDTITEVRRGGTDQVYAGVNYALAAGCQVEKMFVLGNDGTNLTGNELAQAIRGNAADNVLTGLGGADTLTGGGGNDTFAFGTGGGKDIVTDFSSGDVLKISGYTAAQSVVQSGTSVIVTFSRSDMITLLNTDVATVQAGLQFDSSGGGGGGGGSGGATDGDDTLTGTTRNDTLHGLGGNDVISGLAGSDSLFGDAGNDTLRGGLGADTLTGGTGADLFVFEAGGGNDKITDFVSGVDKIDLHLLGTDASAVKTAISGSNLLVSVDADHNGRADFTITLTGVNHIETTDFIFA